MEKDIILIGAGGHALSVLDCMDRDRVAGFVDEYKDGEYVGIDIVAHSLYELEDRDKYKYHISIGDLECRERWKKIIDKLGLELVNVIAKEAYVSDYAVIGKGNFIGKNAVVNAGAKIGDNNIINTGAIVEHGCSIGDNCGVTAVAVLNGDVKLGNRVFIGSNSVCNGQISIGDRATVGSGAVVTKNVEADATVVGVPAREVAL